VVFGGIRVSPKPACGKTVNRSVLPTVGLSLALARVGSMDPGQHPFDVTAVKQRLLAGAGGYEIVHESPGLEIGVYVLVAPEADRQQPHADNEVYVVLEGSGVLAVEGEQVAVREGQAVFVPAFAEHRFSAYEELAVLVIFQRR
jgi:mannose-6-phosphate isomerase-like protein (cupin superfamily)